MYCKFKNCTSPMVAVGNKWKCVNEACSNCGVVTTEYLTAKEGLIVIRGMYLKNITMCHSRIALIDERIDALDSE